MHKTIRVTPRPHCVLCGSPGGELYSGQTDRMFGAPGSWTIKSCRNEKCGLLWPDPFPLQADLGIAYENYYTHAPNGAEGSIGMARRFYRALKRSYIDQKYGYRVERRRSWLRPGFALNLLPGRQRLADEEVRYLPNTRDGRVLDVGCGSGEWLAMMQKLGWQCVGCDFDASVVSCATRRGLDIRHGTIEEQAFADASFDALALNHVIEHLPEPIETLRECRRVLKPGGRLFLASPNASSLSHRVFKRNWRGLEPPRHLHVFSARSIVPALQAAGFSDVRVIPQIAESVLYDSMLLSWARDDGASVIKPRRLLRSAAKFLASFETLLCAFRPQLADCFVALALVPGVPEGTKGGSTGAVAR